MTHPTTPEGTHLTNRNLGYQLGGLRYDQLYEVLIGLAMRIDQDARSDDIRGHKVLAGELTNCSITLNALITNVTRVQNICTSHMQYDMLRNRPATFTITRDDTLQWHD